MKSKDVVFLIIGVITQLVTVFLAQQVIANRERSNRTMQLFYDLIGHLNSFKMAFFRSSSHCRRFHEHNNGRTAREKQIEELNNKHAKSNNITERQELDARIKVLRKALGEEWDDLAKESVESGRERRLATSALVADCLMLEMMYRHKARALIVALTSLKTKSEVFEQGREPDFYDIVFPIEQSLRAEIDQIQKQVTEFWSNQLREVD